MAVHMLTHISDHLAAIAAPEGTPYAWPSIVDNLIAGTPPGTESGMAAELLASAAVRLAADAPTGQHHALAGYGAALIRHGDPRAAQEADDAAEEAEYLMAGEQPPWPARDKLRDAWAEWAHRPDTTHDAGLGENLAQAARGILHDIDRPRYRHAGDPAWESADGDPEGYGDPT
jgi:hypothetical protein